LNKQTIGKIGISIFQAFTKSNTLDKQYDELSEQQRQKKIKSDFENMYIYSPVGGHSGEVLVGQITEVQFGVMDDFVMRIKVYKLDMTNGRFQDNGFLTLNKEDALKGRLFESQPDLLGYVLNQIQTKGIVLGSFHLTQLGILNHLNEIIIEYFADSRLKYVMEDVVRFLAIEKDNLLQKKDTTTSDDMINSLLQISLKIINNREIKITDKYLVMDYTTHAISLLMGSKYREIARRM
jgi:hypothetical protein